MKNLTLLIVVIAIAITHTCTGQDPNFSQFFSSPLNINPALTGHINNDWRVIANFRDQWIGPGNPYVTGTISYDRKFYNGRSVFEDENEGHYAAIGGMLMYDQAMAGVVKSTYASLDGAYSMRLFDGPVTQRLTAGFGVTYGKRSVNFSKVNFEEQFTGSGFDSNLPTGEESLSNMRSYISVSSGMLYTISTEKSNFDIGVAGFHLNEPRQTFLGNVNERIPIRKVVHANYETYLAENILLNTNAVYQWQEKAEYLSFGGALGYILPGDLGTIVNAGMWYWSKNAIIPYVGLAYGKLQFGASYDIAISKLRNTARKPNTWELSIILRGERTRFPTKNGKVPCPWM
jgi:type IX secretion system PorP/SprF family membrane protein